MGTGSQSSAQQTQRTRASGYGVRPQSVGGCHNPPLQRVQRLPHVQQRRTQVGIALCILSWLLSLRSCYVSSMPGTVRSHFRRVAEGETSWLRDGEGRQRRICRQHGMTAACSCPVESVVQITASCSRG